MARRVSDSTLASWIAVGRPIATPKSGSVLEHIAVIQMMLDEHYNILLDLRDARATIHSLVVSGSVMREALQRVIDGHASALPLFAMDRWDEAASHAKDLQTTVSGDIPETKS